MKVLQLNAKCYRSLHEECINLDELNLFIGANASGKSTILDALRFLHEAIQARDFRVPVTSRGGILNLAWKGEDANQVDLKIRLENSERIYEWLVQLFRDRYDFYVNEEMVELHPGKPETRLLNAQRGEGWWWSGNDGKVTLKQGATACALAAAAADASFPARDIVEFVSRWGFFDPNPFLLRRDWSGLESSRFDHYGRNLSETLHGINSKSPDVFTRICEATKSVLGLPTSIEPRESEERFYFVQREPGLIHAVNQMGVSSGTLRVLALMTALLGESDANLIGIEEPENYIHPTALSAFVDYLIDAREKVQLMVTTHSPLLLNFVNDPAAVRVVRRNSQGETTVHTEQHPDGVRQALDASGFGLGEFYETTGFGG